jgi:hypothetical protein
MRRHRTAIRQPPVFDDDRSPVGQFGNEALAGAGNPVEFVGAHVQHAALAPQRQQFRPGHILVNIRARHSVDFEIAVVAEHDALLRVRHHHALAEIVQGRADECIAPQLRTPDLVQRGHHPERDRRQK